MQEITLNDVNADDLAEGFREDLYALLGGAVVVDVRVVRGVEVGLLVERPASAQLFDQRGFGFVSFEGAGEHASGSIFAEGAPQAGDAVVAPIGTARVIVAVDEFHGLQVEFGGRVAHDVASAHLRPATTGGVVFWEGEDGVDVWGFHAY